MPRYYFRGRVPMPVNIGGGEVISVQPKTEFDAPANAVARLVKQKLVRRIADKKVVEEKPVETKKAAPAPAAKAPVAKEAPAAEKKEEAEAEKVESSGKPNRGFTKKKK